MEKLSNDFSKCHFLPANDWKIVDYNLNKQTSIYLQKIERVSDQNKTLGTLIGNQHHERNTTKCQTGFEIHPSLSRLAVVYTNAKSIRIVNDAYDQFWVMIHHHLRSIDMKM